MANEVSILIKGDSSGATRAIKDVEESAGGLGKTLGNIGQVAGGFLAAEAISTGIGMVSGAIRGAFSAAIDYEKLQAQTAAVLESTGNASGQSAEQIKHYAEALSDMSGVQDETIQKAENMLLTFTNIKGTTFPGAAAAVLDMSASFKAAGKAMDISDIAIQVGKALNDPVAGDSSP